MRLLGEMRAGCVARSAGQQPSVQAPSGLVLSGYPRGRRKSELNPGELSALPRGPGLSGGPGRPPPGQRNSGAPVRRLRLRRLLGWTAGAARGQDLVPVPPPAGEADQRRRRSRRKRRGLQQLGETTQAGCGRTAELWQLWHQGVRSARRQGPCSPCLKVGTSTREPYVQAQCRATRGSAPSISDPNRPVACASASALLRPL
jgi:hypothetical protein